MRASVDGWSLHTNDRMETKEEPRHRHWLSWRQMCSRLGYTNQQVKDALVIKGGGKYNITEGVSGSPPHIIHNIQFKMLAGLTEATNLSILEGNRVRHVWIGTEKKQS